MIGSEIARNHYIARGSRRLLRRKESLTPESPLPDQISSWISFWRGFPESNRVIHLSGVTFAKAHFRSRRGLFDVTDASVTEYLRPTPQEMWLQNNTTVQDGECYPFRTHARFRAHPRQPAKLSGGVLGSGSAAGSFTQ